MTLDVNTVPFMEQMDVILRRCIHCGMCLSDCPTYHVLRFEADSPRGRIAMTGAVQSGRVNIEPAFIENIDRCLGCFACISACPSEVNYNQILDLAHQMIFQARPPKWSERLFRWLVMRQLLPHVNRLRILALFGSLYHAFGLSGLAQKLLPFLPRFLQTAEGLLPEKPYQPRTQASSNSSRLKYRGRVGLFTGCIQEAFLGNVNQATVRVLERNGFEVVIPADQTCCGALQIHMSEYGIATNLAKQNVRAFLNVGVETIVCNAGGCEAAMKGYPELLKNDPVFGKLALDFCSKLRDISEFLVEQKAKPPRNQLPVKAAYADSCHLRNIQCVIDQPRFILSNIPGLELVELAHPERCCGSAGVYNLLHPDISDPLLDDKVKDIQTSGVDVVLVANPGCQLQIQAGLRRNGVPVRALHFIELLDEAYRMEVDNIC